MDVVVKLFGPAEELARRNEVTVTLSVQDATCSALRSVLASAEPRLAPLLPGCRFAVNHGFASDDLVIEPEDEVALIALVSGG